MDDTRKVGTFPHFDDKYKCCCSTMHISHGGRLIIITNFIALLFAVPFFLNYGSPILSAFHWITFIADLAFTILAFVGMKKNSSKYLRPYLILSTFAVLYTFVEFTANHIIVTSPNSSLSDALKATVEDPNYAKIREFGQLMKEGDRYWMYQKEAQLISTAYALEMIIWLFDVFCLYICYKYYRYLRDIEGYYGKINGDIEARY